MQKWLQQWFLDKLVVIGVALGAGAVGAELVVAQVLSVGAILVAVGGLGGGLAGAHYVDLWWEKRRLGHLRKKLYQKMEENKRNASPWLNGDWESLRIGVDDELRLVAEDEVSAGRLSGEFREAVLIVRYKKKLGMV